MKWITPFPIILLVVFCFFCTTPELALAQCNTISVNIGSPLTDWDYTGYFYQTFTMPQNGEVSIFNFLGYIPGGLDGNITYRVYSEPGDVLLTTATIHEYGASSNQYFGVNLGYQSTLYFTAGATLKISVSANSEILTRAYLNTANPYSGGGYDGYPDVDLSCHLYTSDAPSISLSSPSLVFGSQTVGTVVTDSVTLTNPGCGPLIITSASVSNSQFGVTPSSASIAGGGSQVFYVTFAPSGTSSAADSVTFASDAPVNATRKLPLSGTGIFQPQSGPGNELTFDGSTSYLETSTNPSIASSSFTYELWAKSATSTPSGWFGGQGTENTDQGLHLGYVASTEIRFGMWADDIDFTPVTDAGHWHHFAFVFDAGTKFQGIYRDGVLVASRTANSVFTGSGTFYIGRIFTNVASSFNGTLDEVRLWNVARTAAQIRENMHLSLSGNEAGLLGYWRLDEANGSIAGDGTGHGYAAAYQSTIARSASTAPLGDGTSSSVFSVRGGTNSLGTVSVAVADSFDNAVDLTATQILSAPDSLPEGSTTILADRYWVVDVFGTPGTYFVNPTFTVPSSFTINGSGVASLYTLYSRWGNSDSSWTAVRGHAVGITSTTITFDSVSALGQFSIGSDNVLPIELASLGATVLAGNDVHIEWATVSETNNYGFFVERQKSGSTAWLTVSGLIAGAGTSLQQHHYSFTDAAVANGTYAYRTRQVDLDGRTAFSQAIKVDVSGVLGIHEGNAPLRFALLQNYPNPFNPTTNIEYRIADVELVTLTVTDILGREVAKLVNGVQQPGDYTATWDATGMPSGFYFYRIVTPTHTDVKKMLLLK